MRPRSSTSALRSAPHPRPAAWSGSSPLCRACRGVRRRPRTRSRDIREAITLATAALPGLHDFVEAMEKRELDPEDAMLDLSRIAAGHHGRMLEAAAKLALIGAIAEAAERFAWQDVLDCANFCREAFADLTVPGRC